MDDELYWIAGPEGKGMCVGELNGQVVIGVAMIQHNDSCGCIGWECTSVKRSIMAKA